MILHLDMDAFFASVEERDNPRLRGKCIIVGKQSRRSVVAAANYEARKFGVHSAMPMYQARQKCPDAVFLPPRMDRYKELSNKIISLLKEFSPLVEPVSIDEAYLDITGCTRLHGSPAELGIKIKKNIKETLNLTCSIGIAPNKFLAKIASDMDKPDGLTIIMPDKALQFIESLPIDKVPGVGQTTKRQLELIGIKTLADVKKYPEKTLFKRLGKFGRRLMELSACIDDSPVTVQRPPQSISSEKTLPEDTVDKTLLNKYLLVQAEKVGEELRKKQLRAKTITLKIKHADFKQATRSLTLSAPTQSTKTIYASAGNLLNAYRVIKKVRLIGVGASGLVPAPTPVQLDIFPDGEKQNLSWENVDKAVDAITKKFGKDIIKRATLSKPR